MSTRISSLSIRTTLPSTTSPCLKLLISPSVSARSSSIVVGSGPLGLGRAPLRVATASADAGSATASGDAGSATASADAGSAAASADAGFGGWSRALGLGRQRLVVGRDGGGSRLRVGSRLRRGSARCLVLGRRGCVGRGLVELGCRGARGVFGGLLGDRGGRHARIGC